MPSHALQRVAYLKSVCVRRHGRAGPTLKNVIFLSFERFLENLERNLGPPGHPVRSTSTTHVYRGRNSYGVTAAGATHALLHMPEQVVLDDKPILQRFATGDIPPSSDAACRHTRWQSRVVFVVATYREWEGLGPIPPHGTTPPHTMYIWGLGHGSRKSKLSPTPRRKSKFIAAPSSTQRVLQLWSNRTWSTWLLFWSRKWPS